MLMNVVVSVEVVVVLMLVVMVLFDGVGDAGGVGDVRSDG